MNNVFVDASRGLTSVETDIVGSSNRKLVSHSTDAAVDRSWPPVRFLFNVNDSTFDAGR